MESRQIKFAVSAIAIVIILTASAWAQTLRTGEIVYGRTQNETNGACTTAAIWAVGLDGSNDRFIAYGRHPRISPDGRKLLYKRWDPSISCPTGFEGGFGWFILDLATGIETQISGQSGGAYGAYFSPETNRADRQITADESNTMCQINVDGSNRICYPFGIEPIRGFGHPSVRGNDYKIVAQNYDDNPNGDDDLYTLDYNRTNVQKIPGTTFIDVAPSWSNDGQTIAYDRYVTTCCRTGPYYFLNLYSIKPDGSNNAQLTFVNNLQPGEGFTYGLVWTLDNSIILNAAKINGVIGIYKIVADGSGTILGRIPISPGAPPEWVGGIVPVRGEQQITAWGGATASGGNYSLVDTAGQGFAGQASSGGTFTLQSGFWAYDSLINKAPFDFDGDGKSDLSIFRPSNGTWYLNRSLEGFTAIQFGLSTDKPTPADYDGDGKTDIAVWRPGNGTWYFIKSRDNTTLSLPFGQAGDLPAPADYDADGHADLAVWRPSDGLWYVLLSGSNNTFIQTKWGQSGDQPVAGDYDADGKADLAVWRPNNRIWYVLRSGDGGVTQQPWGLAGDKLVQADYDGDRKTDFAVWRPNEGIWYILRSSNGSVLIQQWGLPTDSPVAADYDGDGRADLAVWRPSSGVWYLLRSQQGYTNAQFGASGDVPVPAAFVP